MRRTMTARQRLAVFANVSRIQSDQETYDMAVNRDVELKRQRARAERAEAERDRLRTVIDNGLRDYMTLEAERDALRTLTPAMMDAAFAAVQPTSGREWFRATYNAAIDAARKEGEG